MTLSKYTGRRIEIVLPSAGEYHRWKKYATARGVTLSKWIRETMITALEGEGSRPRTDLANELARLREENKLLRDQLRLLTATLERAETELFRAKHNIFLETDPVSDLPLSEALVDLLRGGGFWNPEALLESLHINPRDIEALKILTEQLNHLVDFGLVEETAMGWRWKG
jgi:transposase-like protein